MPTMNPETDRLVKRNYRERPTKYTRSRAYDGLPKWDRAPHEKYKYAQQAIAFSFGTEKFYSFHKFVK